MYRAVSDRTQHRFVSLAQGRRLVEAWRVDYNRARPHSSLGYLTPDKFAIQARATTTATLFEPAGLKS